MNPVTTAVPTPRRRADYLELLTEVLEAFARARDVEAALRVALEKIVAVMRAQSAALFVLEGEPDDPRARLECKVCVGPSDITGLSLPATSGIVGRALQTNTTQMVGDARDDPDFVPPPTLGTAYEVRSIMAAPLSVREQRLGVVEVINRTDGAGLFTTEDREALEALATAAALAIANARLAKEMADQARVRQELELAATVQRRLLPPPPPEGAPIHGISLPARGVSGDFYDVLPLSGGRLAFALADVSGKGFNAALIMVKAATLFRSLGRRAESPGLLLARIESELSETMSRGMFVTMVVGILDPRTGEVRFANAGHVPPIFRDARGNFQEFPAEDPPLGIVGPLENNRYHEHKLRLERGSLYLYTDGAMEGRLADGSMPGIEGLRRLIASHATEPLAERLEALTAPFLLSAELRDDLTWLVVEDRGAAAAVMPGVLRRRPPSILVSQKLAAQASELKILRRLVDWAARRAGATAGWAGDLVLAVDEACQNIIRHGYRGRTDGSIDLTIYRRAGGLEVELVDFAPPVAQDECQGRPLDEVRPGGLGTFFMRELADSVEFREPPEGAGNRLVLTKQLPPASKDCGEAAPVRDEDSTDIQDP